MNEKIEQYKQLVQDYSKVLDLSSPKLLSEFHKAIEKSTPFAEAIAQNATVLDVGSGAGLPAIPIAILRPDITIILCEIRSKRAAFLDRAISSLQLRNATVFQGDVRKLEPKFDVITALWLGSLEQIYSLVQPRLNLNWQIITRKGTELEQEFTTLQAKHPEVQLKTTPLEDGASLVILHGGQ
jgi:16S rRNA (guanine527-N7)-methyltransferase